MIDSIIADGPSALLDEKYYHLNDEELTFFKSQTGIQDEGLLKEHIMKIQADAWKVRNHSYNGPFLLITANLGPSLWVCAPLCIHKVSHLMHATSPCK